MRRPRWAVPLLASAGLHGLAVCWLATRPAPQPKPAVASRALEFEVLAPAAAPLAPAQTAPPAPPAPKPKPKPSPKRARPTSAEPPTSPAQTGSRTASGAEGSSNSSSPAGAALASDRPEAEPASGALSLLPPSVIPDSASISRGVTLYPNAQLEAAVSKAREQARVEGRIRSQLAEGFAEARAENGLASPHVTAWGHALEAALGEADGGQPAQLGVTDANAGLKLAYRRALEAWGKTGNPGFAPPGQAPTLSENLARIEAPMGARLAAQAQETRLALQSVSPLFSVTLDLEQATNGEVLRAELLTHSGNVRFDDFVLSAVPRALAKTTPPKAPLHATWEIEGWLRKDPNLVDAVSQFISVTGPILDQLVSIDPRHAHFEYRARLLRAY